MLAEVTHMYPEATCTFTNNFEIFQGNAGRKYFTRQEFSKF